MSTSCTIAKIGGKGPVPLMLNQPTEKMKFIDHITVKKNINFDYTNSFDIAEVLNSKAGDKIRAENADVIANTSITIKSGADNFFINLVTLGLAQSRKVVVDADLMKSESK